MSIDSMAESYLQQQQQQQQELQAPSSQSVQRQTSMNRGYSVQQAPPPGAYGAQQPHLQSQVYQAQQQQLSYTQLPAHSPVYASPPTHPYAAAAPAQVLYPPPPQQQYAPPPPANGALQRGVSASGVDYYGVPAHQSSLATAADTGRGAPGRSMGRCRRSRWCCRCRRWCRRRGSVRTMGEGFRFTVGRLRSLSSFF